MTTFAQVGVRELRQNLSVYLRRVARGETLEVTEHGHPVALLQPLPAVTSPIERLRAMGRVTRPEGDLLDVGLPSGRSSTTLSDALAEMRGDRI